MISNPIQPKGGVAPTEPARPFFTYRLWSSWILVALGLLLLRLPSILHRFNIDDEGLYSVVAIEHMHGARLYADVVDRKPPLLYAAYQAVFAVAGVNMMAIHLASAVWTLLTMAGLAVAAWHLFGKTAALMAAILYGIYSGYGPYTNLAWNGELLTNLPIVWALVVVFWRGNSRLRPGLLGAGALLGIAFLLKQPGATSALALGVYLLLPSYRRKRGLTVSHSFLHAGFLCLGFAVVLGGMTFQLYAQNALTDAIYWAFRHHDMPRGPLDAIFWERFLVGGSVFALACLPLWVGAITALKRDNQFFFGKELEAERTAIILLIGLAVVGVSASGRFYFHYFLLMLPGLVLSASMVLGAVLDGNAVKVPRMIQHRSVPWVLGGSAVLFLVLHVTGLAKRQTGSEAAAFIRTHSEPSDRIFIWGENPTIYLESERRSASRYISTFPLTGYPYGGVLSYEPTQTDTSHRIVPGTWKILDRELSQHPPRFIIDAESKRKFPFYHWKNYPLLASHINHHYQRVLDARDGIVYERIDPRR